MTAEDFGYREGRGLTAAMLNSRDGQVGRDVPSWLAWHFLVAAVGGTTVEGAEGGSAWLDAYR